MQIKDAQLPLVSILVPVYNGEDHLEECLYSAINQTYHNLEIIVVDDGSTDTSPEICRKLQGIDTRIVYLRKSNGGVSAARNLALQNATGDYFVFLDADDILECTMVEKLIGRLISTCSEVGFCAIDIFYGERRAISSAYTSDLIPPKLAVSQCFQHVNSWINAVWGKMFSRAILTTNNSLLCFDESLLIGEDYLWLMQVLTDQRLNQVCCIGDALYSYRRFSDKPSLSNFHGDRYIARKDSLIQADEEVVNLFAKLKWFDLYTASISKLAHDYVNSEVVINYLFGRATLHEYSRGHGVLVKKIISDKGLSAKDKIVFALIHFSLKFPFPHCFIGWFVKRAERKRAENLYL